MHKCKQRNSLLCELKSHGNNKFFSFSQVAFLFSFFFSSSIQKWVDSAMMVRREVYAGKKTPSTFHSLKAATKNIFNFLRCHRKIIITRRKLSEDINNLAYLPVVNVLVFFFAIHFLSVFVCMYLVTITWIQLKTEYNVSLQIGRCCFV